MYRFRPRRTIGALALVAMLLLALLPSLGRMLGRTEHAGHAVPGETAAHAMRAHAMAGSHGSHHVGMHHGGMHHGGSHHDGSLHDGMQHDGMHAAGHAQRPVPRRQVPTPPHHGDCEYCPLLAALVMFDVPGALAPPSLAPRAALPARITAPRGVSLVPGLGARGPPASGS